MSILGHVLVGGLVGLVLDVIVIRGINIDTPWPNSIETCDGC